MANIARYTGPLIDLDTVVVFDDFWADRDDQQWIDTITDTGTVSVADGARGILTVTPSDGTVVDNDEAYFGSANEVFIFAAGRPMYARARLQFTETSSGVYNAFFGFANAIAANTLVDDGGGMRASGSIATINKIDGGAVWRLTTRDNSGATTTTSTTTAGGASYQVLEIIVNDWDSTYCQVFAKVDGRWLLDSNGAVIKHTVAYASVTEMQIGGGAKLGADTNNDTLNFDYVYAHQLR